MWMGRAPCEDKQKHTWKEPAFANRHLSMITLPQPVRMSRGKVSSSHTFLWKTTLFPKLHTQLRFSDLVKAKKGMRKPNDNRDKLNSQSTCTFLWILQPFRKLFSSRGLMLQ